MKPPDEALQGLVDAWLKKADQDLLAVERLLEFELVLGGVIAFHAQQAVEKAMKAILTRHQIAFPRTHDLGVLLTLLAHLHPGLNEDLRDVTVLTDYGVEVRYPGDSQDLTREEVLEAAALARHAREVLVRLL